MTPQKDIKSFIWMDINRGLVKSQVTSLNLNYIIGKNDTSKKIVSNTWLAITFNKSICLHNCILSMKALLKSNRFTNYDFAPLKKLNRLRFIILTPPSIFFYIKAC